MAKGGSRKAQAGAPLGVGPLVLRNITIDKQGDGRGQRTSMRLEQFYWDLLDEIAVKEGLNLKALCTEIWNRHADYLARREAEGEKGPVAFTSSVCVFITGYFHQRATHGWPVEPLAERDLFEGTPLARSTEGSSRRRNLSGNPLSDGAGGAITAAALAALSDADPLNDGAGDDGGAEDYGSTDAGEPFTAVFGASDSAIPV